MPTSRKEALRWMATASLRGYLGFFVGSGFSQAATSCHAPGFDKLLRDIADLVGAPTSLDDAIYKRMSFPQIASRILKFFKESGSPGDHESLFRDHIARFCNLAPDNTVASKLSNALNSSKPSWIVTTNYDLLLEALMENSQSLLPTSPLVPNMSRPPIYHLHGHRHIPSTIKITEEDYVGLIAPLDYRRLKLPLLLFESTTVMIGYALGDINVRAAIEWAKSFQSDASLGLPDWQGRVFHAVRVDTPSPDPQKGGDGQIIIEISEIEDFLNEIGAIRIELENEEVTAKQWIRNFLQDPSNSLAVASDDQIRKNFLSVVNQGLQYCAPTSVIDFIDRALAPIWTRARERNAFEHYATYLALIVDILGQIGIQSANPAIVFYLGDALDRVGSVIDPQKRRGSAHAATDIWMKGHLTISQEVKKELKEYAIGYSKTGLYNVLKIAS